MAWNAELLAFVAFDILHKDGEDPRPLPVIERKVILWNLVKPADGVIQYSQYLEGGGAEFFAAERMASKALCRSSYRSGTRDEAWVREFGPNVLVFRSVPPVK
ncbi:MULTISPECIES: hypothetical protein [Mesorhizobium]|uniref:hypothetical protein n=1 Tax=Mesorhizobium TaxID=68287 RepID=UPI0003CE22A5|nr:MULTISPECIES: hypothetical protein [Mesorhizobium]ESY63625.1 hypothetical protein X742_28505 [Mesorhizobium sp. LNHC232B00]WJI38192.1 hypothetical protein NL534_30720 [Mesorhizobium opportunistum]